MSLRLARLTDPDTKQPLYVNPQEVSTVHSEMRFDGPITVVAMTNGAIKHAVESLNDVLAALSS